MIFTRESYDDNFYLDVFIFEQIDEILMSISSKHDNKAFTKIIDHENTIEPY